jgi:hypothetical protein
MGHSSGKRTARFFIAPQATADHRVIEAEAR